MRGHRTLSHAAIVTAALVMLVGCAVTQEAGKPFRAAARHRLVVDGTTRPEAEKLLGPPFKTTTDAQGREQVTYEHTRVSALRAIPFGRRVTVEQTPYEQLVLTFQGGLLKDCLYLTERYRTEGELIVATGTSREPCGRPRGR